jgi:hypothetical protein
MAYYESVKVLLWDVSKNEKLRQGRGITFEEVAAKIDGGGAIAVIPSRKATRQYRGKEASHEG